MISSIVLILFFCHLVLFGTSYLFNNEKNKGYFLAQILLSLALSIVAATASIWQFSDVTQGQLQSSKEEMELKYEGKNREVELLQSQLQASRQAAMEFRHAVAGPTVPVDFKFNAVEKYHLFFQNGDETIRIIQPGTTVITLTK